MGDEDKQFEASQQKLEKARKEGQVVKSKDVDMALSMVVMMFLIFKLAPFIWHQITKLFTLMYEQIPNQHLDTIGLPYLFTITVVPTVAILAPILFVACLIGIIGNIIQIGPLFTTAPLEPKFDKLNPTKYFKNIFSIKTMFELVKNILKVILFGIIGYMVYKKHLPMIMQLAAVDNSFAIMNEFGSLMLDFITKMTIAFLVLAAADYGVTKWKFLQDQKMSFKEVKDEYKNSEGDPQVKAQLRARRQQMMQRGMMDSVPEADFVVTNPTHVACALKYDQKTMASPKLIAKGTELIAKEIIKIAKEHNIPVVENPPVARALFRMVDLNKEISPDLYKAVAEILIFVYNLRKNKKSDNILKDNN